MTEKEISTKKNRLKEAVSQTGGDGGGRTLVLCSNSIKHYTFFWFCNSSNFKASKTVIGYMRLAEPPISRVFKTAPSLPSVLRHVHLR